MNGSSLRSGAALPSVGPTPNGDRAEFVFGAAEHVELSLDVVIRCGPRPNTGRQPLHQPTARYSDQFPLHRTRLLQRHCA